MDGDADVVCGYDGSDEAVRAVAWAGVEAERRGTGLRIVTALGWATFVHASGEMVEAPAVGPEASEVALRTVEEVAATVRQTRPTVAVTPVVRSDAAVSALLDEAERAALVVVGARGRGGFQRMLLGSVSTAVAEHAACPVVVIRAAQRSSPGATTSGGSVVAAVDGSPASARVLAFAFEAAAARTTPLLAVHAVHMDPFVEELEHMPRHGDLSSAAAAERLLTDALEPWRGKYPEVAVRHQTLNGHPVQAISAAAAGAGLLVVGTQGGGDLKAALLGSVSRGLLHHATGPVAVVPHG